MLPFLSPLGGHVSVTDVTFVSVSKVTARVELTDVLAVVRPNTCLISIMLANNETGIIMVKRKQSLGESLRWKCISLYFVTLHAAPCTVQLNVFPCYQPVQEICQRIKSLNQKRRFLRILLHTDAAQALGKIRVDVCELGVDYLTIVGHKV